MGTQALRDQLRTQLGFLRASCELYDAGAATEAIRIATILRVLLKDPPVKGAYKNRSQALMRRFELVRPVYLLSSVQGEVSGRSSGGLSLPIMQLTGEDSDADPKISIRPAFEMKVLAVHDVIPRREWNEQVIYHLDFAMTRQDIYLGAADKDGGAHVDAELDPQYKRLKDGLIDFHVVGKEGGRKLNNGHLADLRQMAFEVLNSPDILALERGEWLQRDCFDGED